MSGTSDTAEKKSGKRMRAVYEFEAEGEAPEYFDIYEKSEHHLWRMKLIRVEEAREAVTPCFKDGDVLFNFSDGDWYTISVVKSGPPCKPAPSPSRDFVSATDMAKGVKLDTPVTPKCKDGHHVTIDGGGMNCTDEESGRTFEFRQCIHCGEGVENQTSPGKSKTPPADALRPCPFCGGEAKVSHTDNDLYHWAHCTSCDMTMKSATRTDAEARAAWNRRSG